MRSLRGFLVIILCLACLGGHAGYVFLKDKSSLTFTASTWLGDVTGNFADWSIEGNTTATGPSDLKFKVLVQTQSLNTKKEKRDKHLKTEEYFWVEKYPLAKFESSQITMKDPGHFHVKGLLNFRGVQKNIEFDANFENSNSLYHVSGNFVLNRRDFGITTEGIFLVSIRDNVTVNFDVWGNKASP